MPQPRIPLRRNWHSPGCCRAPPTSSRSPARHHHRLEENAAAVSLKISADTEDALLQVFAPGAASGLRYPENHLARLGI